MSAIYESLPTVWMAVPHCDQTEYNVAETLCVPLTCILLYAFLFYTQMILDSCTFLKIMYNYS